MKEGTSVLKRLENGTICKMDCPEKLTRIQIGLKNRYIFLRNNGCLAKMDRISASLALLLNFSHSTHDNDVVPRFKNEAETLHLH